MAIRTRNLAQGAGTGPGTTVLYTVAGGLRVRTTQLVLSRSAGAGQPTFQYRRPTAPARPIVVPTLATGTPQRFALGDVLEGGDVIELVIPALVTVAWWLSGTTYQD